MCSADQEDELSRLIHLPSLNKRTEPPANIRVPLVINPPFLRRKDLSVANDLSNRRSFFYVRLMLRTFNLVINIGLPPVGEILQLLTALAMV